MSEHEILELIKRDPGELAFVMQENTYEDYVNTYIDAGGTANDAVFSEEEYKALREFFNHD